MESWNHIINTALLGTDKRMLKKEDIVSDLSEDFDLIASQTQNKEDLFLQTAALMYNYRQCGFVPMHKETVSILQAEEEVKAYVNPLAQQVLYDIIEAGSISLLQFWLEKCVSAKRIVQPELIPVLLDGGMRHKSIQSLVYDCCGKRGAWLMQFNDDWKHIDPLPDEELWQTGSLEQRKNILLQLRKNSPAKGRGLLQQIWVEENAAAKAELVQQLAINAGEEDLPFLEDLLNEKSVRVKDEAIKILKKIPSSSIVQLYWRLLKPAIGIKKEKALLGLSSKMVLETLPIKEVDEFIYKTGLEKMSSEKNVSDQNFLLYQLIMSVPPSFFERHLNLGKEEILKSLLHHSLGKNFLPAFGLAAIRFNELEWLRAVTAQEESQLYIGAFQVLPQKEAEQYAIRHLEKESHAADIINRISNFANEWSIDLAKTVLKFTAKNSYQYNKGFYNQIIHLLPIPIVGELEKCTPKEEHLRTMWSNTSEHINRMLTLKLQAFKAFNE